MVRLNTCYSNRKARKMQDNKLKIQKIKASIKDYSYLAFCALIVIVLFNRFELSITLKGHSSTKVAQAKEIEVVKEIVKTETQITNDHRADKLRAFLESKGSPLAPYSQLIINEADKYDIGWTKVVAISGIESAYATKLPTNSHNAWGLGGSNFMRFANWEEGIQYASYLLGTHYKQQENQGIKSKYCPASDGCNPSWAKVVTDATKDILALEGK